MKNGLAILLLALLTLGATGCKKYGAATTPPRSGAPGAAATPRVEPKTGTASEEEVQTAADPCAAAGHAAAAADQAPAAVPDPVPPYITLGIQSRPGEIILCEGQPVPLYFELAADTPDTCWVALVPDGTESKLAGDNRQVAIQEQPISGERMSQLLFIMPKPGEYRLRLFTSNADSAEYVSEAQPFRVVSQEEWTELGKQSKAAAAGS